MTSEQQDRAPHTAKIAIDAMGGDRGPEAIVAGLAIVAKKQSNISFILHGDEAVLAPLLAEHKILSAICEISHAEDVVSMTDKPSQVMRHGKKTSMWSTVDCVRNKEAQAAVSCGNTGALMLLSMVRLKKMPGVNRPAIACLWPSKNPCGSNIMLDVGADIRADESDLLQYALMGTSYARNGLGLAKPRIGLLNVGTEENKGRPELKAAYELISAQEKPGNFEFVGFVEGVDIPSDRVDVIVTDGFTGNIALKTAEGTASLVSGFLREAFNRSLLSKLSALFALPSLNHLKSRADPRRNNGGVFLGLNGTVIKSHGSSDATGVASAVNLAIRLAKSDFNHKLAARVASAETLRQDTENKSPEEVPIP